MLDYDGRRATKLTRGKGEVVFAWLITIESWVRIPLAQPTQRHTTMFNLYNRNSLIFWNEEEIKLRRIFEEIMVNAVKTNLLSQNSAFQFFQVEAPTLIPREYVSAEYDEENLFVTNRDDLVLRAETTASSYLYAEYLMKTHHEMKVRPPFVVWQHAKSYRNEQDKVLKNMRLKEFYQLEFQILFKNTTKNDYSVSLMPAVQAAFESMIGKCRLEESDRLPSYSEQTIDVVCEKNDMEVCSMSKRNDFPVEDINVFEVALGTDRCIYNFKNK